MSEIKVNTENIETLKQQFSEWAFYLNNCVGVLAFTLALASLGTKSPSTNALISFIFLLTVYFSGSRNKLKLLKKLRKKKDKTEEEKIFLKGIHGLYFNIFTMLRNYPVFTIGYLFLTFVIFVNSLSKHWSWINYYL